MPRIIVVEDEDGLREQLVAYLTLSGFDACPAGSAGELYRRMAVERFGIVVLDLRLPDEDGLSIAAHLRKQLDVGIIMLTARTGSDDRTRGFDAGADIYLTKPLEMPELVAAVRSLSRRLGLGADRGAAAGTRPVSVEAPAAAWRLDKAAFTLEAPNGKQVNLTINEVSLLARLTAQPGVVVSRGELLGALGYDPLDPGNRNLDAALRRLRLKVEASVGCQLPVRTIHSVGYIFEAQ